MRNNGKENEVFIVSACRTPIGNFGGALKDYSAIDLGGAVIKEAIKVLSEGYYFERYAIMGNVLSAGLGQNPARQAVLRAELIYPHLIHCLTVNKVCGSGLQAVVSGYDLIKSGRGDMVIAGGMESMSNAPYLTARPYVKKCEKIRLNMGNFLHSEAMAGEIFYDGEVPDPDVLFQDSMLKDGLTDAYNYRHMGEIADCCAKEHNISREAQDDFAILSNELAVNATKSGFFDDEIVAMGNINQDEGITKFNPQKMNTMKPVFGETITAGNASKLSDGAAALVLISSSLINLEGLTPLARVVDVMEVSMKPDHFPEAPFYAICQLLVNNNLKADDIDLWEINEAFASVPIYSMEVLKIPREKVNVHGGAVALGHPIGASGARILVTLVHAMKRHNKNRGVAAICIGGGEALAVLVELV